MTSQTTSVRNGMQLATFGPSTYSHIGIFVRNLEEGMDEYGNLLNIEFREPVTASLEAMQQPNVEETAKEVRFVNSINGPPYYELIEMTGSGVYSPEKNTVGFHHVALWIDETDLLEEINKKDSSIVAIFWAPDGSPRACYSQPVPPTNLRIEYLNSKLRARFEHLWATGKLPD